MCRRGRFADPQRVHPIEHVGRFFSVRGPLNVPRPPQGNPVVVIDWPTRRPPALSRWMRPMSCWCRGRRARPLFSRHQRPVRRARFAERHADTGERPRARRRRARRSWIRWPERRERLLRFVGTAAQLLDLFASWVREGVCDGFNLLPAVLPDDLETFVRPRRPAWPRTWPPPQRLCRHDLARASRLAAPAQPVRRMTARKQLHLGLFIYPGGHHIAGWRHPSVAAATIASMSFYDRRRRAPPNGASSTCSSSATCWRRARRTAGSSPRAGSTTSIRSRSPRPSRRSPNAWASWPPSPPPTTSPSPSPSASPSLDHISGGRAGWNIITTHNDDAALNFSRKQHMEKTLRYERAQEFVDICKGLWDSWDDDALTLDRGAGRSPTRRASTRSTTRASSSAVAGPARPAAPAAGLAGAGAGRRLAGRDGVRRRCGRGDLRRPGQPRGGIKFRNADPREMAEHGRDPELLKILPGLSPIIGSTEAEAPAQGAGAGRARASRPSASGC